MPNRRSISIYGAASFLVALLISDVGAWAADKAQPPSQVVRRAQDLALHHRRKEALKLLEENLLLALAKTSERESLRETLADLANRFISDKGQRGFELGQSLLPAQPAQALHHFQEAEKLEDGNLQVALGMVRAHLAADDCRAAEASLEGLEHLYSVSAALQELAIEVAWCREDQSKVEALIKVAPGDQRLSAATIKTANAWIKWMSSDAVKAASLIREAVAADPQNPAALYWLWRVEKDTDRDPDEVTVPAAQAFLQRCRGKEREIRRRQAALIEMCLRVAEVEAYLKTRPTENGNGQ